MANTAMIKVTALTNEARRGLSDLEKNQFPFALAKTLTEIATLAVEGVKRTTRQEFRLHSEFIPKGIARTSARKADVKNKGIGSTVIFTKPIISGWMPVHETGGTREAKSGSGGGRDKGKYLAIPATDLLKRSYRTGTGAVRRRWKPSELLTQYKGRNVSLSGGVVRPTRGGRKGKPFIIRSKGSGVPMIVRRKGPKRYPLELLYIFSRKARYKPVWGFEKAVNEIVDLRFASRLRANLSVAVRNAR